MPQPINLFDYEAMAKEKLSQNAYGYYVSGANDEVTLRENRAAFDRITLRPRMFIDVSQRDLSVEVLGRSMPMPLVIAPTAFGQLAHPDGHIATVRAAGKVGLTTTISTLTNYSMEEIAAEASGPLWFQLYVYKDRGVTRELVSRAEAAGCTALVLTVDSPVLGKRERDIRNGFHLPEGLTAKNLAQSYERMSSIEEEASGSALTSYVNALYDTSLTWDDLAWLTRLTSLPILVKGILRGDDAQLAVAYGAKGIIVSNHGGRQLDTAPATIRVLPEIVAAVRGRADVLLDGGIRRGTDILKAVALGANAVLVGRPTLWGLAADGEAGVTGVLEILRDEFDTALALSGCPRACDLSADYIVG